MPVSQSLSTAELAVLAAQLRDLKANQIQTLLWQNQIPASNPLDVRSLTTNQQRVLLFAIQRLKEEKFREQSEKAELARRKEITEKRIQAERSVIREILASSSEEEK